MLHYTREQIELRKSKKWSNDHETPNPSANGARKRSPPFGAALPKTVNDLDKYNVGCLGVEKECFVLATLTFWLYSSVRFFRTTGLIQDLKKQANKHGKYKPQLRTGGRFTSSLFLHAWLKSGDFWTRDSQISRSLGNGVSLDHKKVLISIIIFLFAAVWSGRHEVQ